MRYFLLSVPFRKQLNFTFDALQGAERTVQSLRDFRARLEEARTEAGSNEGVHHAIEKALKDFEAGMDDDLNTSVALAAIHDLTRVVNPVLAEGKLLDDNRRELISAVERFDSVLNIFGKPQRELLDEEIQALIDERQEARHRRDFARADEIRMTRRPRHHPRRHQDGVRGRRNKFGRGEWIVLERATARRSSGAGGQ